MCSGWSSSNSRMPHSASMETPCSRAARQVGGGARLPEQYNWYNDRQKRIGGRCAILAKLDVHGREVGVASIHLENRTDGEPQGADAGGAGRGAAGVWPVCRSFWAATEYQHIRRTRQRLYPSSGGSSGRACRQYCKIDSSEPLLTACGDAGYAWRTASGDGRLTRRKPVGEGNFLAMRLDWIIPRGFTAKDSRVISTVTADIDSRKRAARWHVSPSPS